MQIFFKLIPIPLHYVFGVLIILSSTHVWANHEHNGIDDLREHLMITPIPTMKVISTGPNYQRNYADPILSTTNIDAAVQSVSAAAIEGVEYYISDMEADLLSIEEGYRSAEAKLAAALIEVKGDINTTPFTLYLVANWTATPVPKERPIKMIFSH